MAGVLRAVLGHIGAIAILTRDTARLAVRPPYEVRPLIDQLHHLGVRSLTITNITLLFSGMVVALQTAYSLAAFGAKYVIGDVVSLTLVRELGPVLTALMVGGRVGAGITAEIGSMAVTEQVDAIRALAANPIKKLVVPKVVATLIMLPILTILADFVGILGGLFISVFELDQSGRFYWEHVRAALDTGDICSGIGKTFFFALFISVFGCYNGLNAQGGADGVGHATTNTVVMASIAVLVSDFFLTKLFLLF